MSEKSEIKRMKAKAQKNSGRTKYAKGDAIKGPFCYDIKEYSKCFSLSKDVWAKVCTDAMRSGNYSPALQLVLGTEHKVRLWIVEEEIINHYLKLLSENE